MNPKIKWIVIVLVIICAAAVVFIASNKDRLSKSVPVTDTMIAMPELIYSETLPKILKKEELVAGGAGYYVVLKNEPKTFHRVWQDEVLAVPGKIYYGQSVTSDVPNSLKKNVAAEFNSSQKDYLIVSHLWDGGPGNEFWSISDILERNSARQNDDFKETEDFALDERRSPSEEVESKWVYAAELPPIFKSDNYVYGGSQYYVIFAKSRYVLHEVWSTNNDSGAPGIDADGKMYYGGAPLDYSKMHDGLVPYKTIPEEFKQKVDATLSSSKKDYIILSAGDPGGFGVETWDITSY